VACLNGSVSSVELFIRSVDVLNRASLLESLCASSTVWRLESDGCCCNYAVRKEIILVDLDHDGRR
jgi:hypothetical protein